MPIPVSRDERQSLIQRADRILANAFDFLEDFPIDIDLNDPSPDSFFVNVRNYRQRLLDSIQYDDEAASRQQRDAELKAISDELDADFEVETTSTRNEAPQKPLDIDNWRQYVAQTIIPSIPSTRILDDDQTPKRRRTVYGSCRRPQKRTKTADEELATQVPSTFLSAESCTPKPPRISAEKVQSKPLSRSSESKIHSTTLKRSSESKHSSGPARSREPTRYQPSPNTVPKQATSKLTVERPSLRKATDGVQTIVKISSKEKSPSPPSIDDEDTPMTAEPVDNAFEMALALINGTSTSNLPVPPTPTTERTRPVLPTPTIPKILTAAQLSTVNIRVPSASQSGNSLPVIPLSTDDFLRPATSTNQKRNIPVSPQIETLTVASVKPVSPPRHTPLRLDDVERRLIISNAPDRILHDTFSYTRIVVSGMEGCDPYELEYMFAYFGPILSIHAYDQDEFNRLSFAFIEYRHAEDAEQAVRAHRTIRYKGQRVVVDFSAVDFDRLERSITIVVSQVLSFDEVAPYFARDVVDRAVDGHCIKSTLYPYVREITIRFNFVAAANRAKALYRSRGYEVK